MKNNISYNNVTADYEADNILGSANNLSSDATSPDVGFQSLSVNFVDEAGDDFHLSGTDTNAQGQGVDLSNDTFRPFSLDIDGDTRSTPWDLGADQL